MLTKLLPDQIAKFWDVIRYGIEQSTPPISGEAPNKMSRILISLLSGKTDCWISYRREGENTIFEAVCLTSLIFDDASYTRKLLIYCVYGYEKTIEETWQDAFLAVAEYAKSKHCNEVVAYVETPYMVEKARLFGGDTRYTYVSFNINKTIKLINDLWR